MAELQKKLIRLIQSDVKDPIVKDLIDCVMILCLRSKMIEPEEITEKIEEVEEEIAEIEEEIEIEPEIEPEKPKKEKKKKELKGGEKLADTIAEMIKNSDFKTQKKMSDRLRRNNKPIRLIVNVKK